ncbi:sensor histidine kinase [Lipingzhangella sp. LS1_29]|uniref:histidine kinase n=1 Tax=Lipingzhangella rawalii TaxID=2055835 RepID=A0ABU2H461_9ACTN|nr:sensor histidine kinase [Lipingzhangella rawalii]MDS1270104.1 sensor histidine kinase [Lipingzhangella rawalii]
MTAGRERRASTMWARLRAWGALAGTAVYEALVRGPELAPGETGGDRGAHPHRGRMVLGVCRAIAGDSPTAVVAVRCVMAAMILASGVGILLYLLLWFVLPSELTRSEPEGQTERPAAHGLLRATLRWATVLLASGVVAATSTQQLLMSQVAWPAALGGGLLVGVPLLFVLHAPLPAWRVLALGNLLAVVLLGLQGPAAVPQDTAYPIALWPWPVTGLLALAVALYLVATRLPARVTVAVGGLTVCGVLLPAAVLVGTPGWQPVWLGALVGVILAYGHTVRGRRAARRDLERETELRRQDQARQAVLKERSRIARELHDVVSHHMSMIAIQADAAPYKHPELSSEATATFHTLRDTAREALGEMRRVVGLLREDTEHAERDPQPGLAQLETLVAGVRAAGVAVDLRVRSPDVPLPDAVDVSVYRIVQEALSNASRHAPGAAVEVRVEPAGGQLVVSVRNGPGSHVDTPAAPDPGGGHGLVGMRERVVMLGGSLRTGTLPDGGFQVVAQLPITVSTGSGG